MLLGNISEPADIFVILMQMQLPGSAKIFKADIPWQVEVTTKVYEVVLKLSFY